MAEQQQRGGGRVAAPAAACRRLSRSLARSLRRLALCFPLAPAVLLWLLLMLLLRLLSPCCRGCAACCRRAPLQVHAALYVMRVWELVEQGEALDGEQVLDLLQVGVQRVCKQEGGVRTESGSRALIAA